MFGWRKSPEDALKERKRLANRDLRNNVYEQEALQKAIAQIDASLAREKDPIQKRRLVTARVMKQRELDECIVKAQRTGRTIKTMDRTKDMCTRLDDARALDAAMSSMSRGATPAEVGRIQESLLTSQSSLEIVGDMLNDMDQPSTADQEDVDDEVDHILEMMDSAHALDVDATSFPIIPSGSAPSPSPHPHPSVQDIEERLQRLMAIN